MTRFALWERQFVLERRSLFALPLKRRGGGVQLNDVLSVGLHRVWKRAAIKWSDAGSGDCVLDVCCGSGDLALRLASVVGRTGAVRISFYPSCSEGASAGSCKSSSSCRQLG